jgi:hypothetical protein
MNMFESVKLEQEAMAKWYVKHFFYALVLFYFEIDFSHKSTILTILCPNTKQVLHRNSKDGKRYAIKVCIISISILKVVD